MSCISKPSQMVCLHAAQVKLKSISYQLSFYYVCDNLWARHGAFITQTVHK